MLDRFIFCPCKHALEAHSINGCSTCGCLAGQRDVIDGLLEFERDAIHDSWLACGSSDSGTKVVRASP